MSHRRKDFHNSRAYEPDPPASAPGRLSSAIAWVKQGFEKLLRSGASSSMSTVTLLLGREEPYSLLGSDRRARPSDRPEDAVFPMSDRDPGFQTRLQPARTNDPRRRERRAER